MSRRARNQQSNTALDGQNATVVARAPTTGSILPSRQSLWLCSGLLVVTLFAYWNVWTYGYQVFDDGNYVSHNRIVLNGLTAEGIAWAFTTFRLSNWHPLTWLSFLWDSQLYGDAPGGFHATNLALHATNVLLLYVLLAALTGCRVRSAFVAAFFAVHPLHVESVAWISERKDVLSTAFGLIALIAYVRYARQPSKSWYLASLIAFICSLLSKQMLVTLPVLLGLLDAWPLRRWGQMGTEEATSSGSENISTVAPSVSRPAARRLVLEKVPYWVVAIGFCIAIIAAQRHGGGLTSLERFGWDVRMKNAAVAGVLYLWKTVWPIDLAVYYPHPGESISTTAATGAAFCLLSLSTAAFVLRQRAPYFFFGWCWYLIALLPVIGIVQVGEQQMADRYTYIPHIGLFVVVAWGIPALLPDVRLKSSIVTGMALSSILLFAAQCRTQVEYWRDNTSMLVHTVKVTGGSHFAHHNLAIAYVRQRDYDLAMPHFRTAIEFEPNSWSSNYSLANCLQITGSFSAARVYYIRALELNPASAEIHNNLGMVNLRQKDFPAAIEHFRRALELRPSLAKARENLQQALLHQSASSSD